MPAKAPASSAWRNNNGVHGRSIGTKGFAGVFGESTGGPGVSAHSTHSVGVDAKTDNGPGRDPRHPRAAAASPASSTATSW